MGFPGQRSSGVVEDVTLVGADSLSLSGFSGLDVTVATYFRLRGDGERWGVRAAAKALGEGDGLAALALTAGADAAAVEALRARAAPLRSGGARRPAAARLPVAFPCLVVRQTRKQKVPDNVPVELASFARRVRPATPRTRGREKLHCTRNGAIRRHRRAPPGRRARGDYE